MTFLKMPAETDVADRTTRAERARARADARRLLPSMASSRPCEVYRPTAPGSRALRRLGKGLVAPFATCATDAPGGVRAVVEPSRFGGFRVGVGDIVVFARTTGAPSAHFRIAAAVEGAGRRFPYLEAYQLLPLGTPMPLPLPKRSRGALKGWSWAQTAASRR